MKRDLRSVFLCSWMIILGVGAIIVSRWTFSMAGMGSRVHMGGGLLGFSPFYFAGIVGALSLFLTLTSIPVLERYRVLDRVVSIWKRAWRTIRRERWIPMLFLSLAVLRTIGQVVYLIEYHRFIDKTTWPHVDPLLVVWSSLISAGGTMVRAMVPHFVEQFSGFDSLLFVLMVGFFALMLTRRQPEESRFPDWEGNASLIRKILVPLSGVCAILLAICLIAEHRFMVVSTGPGGTVDPQWERLAVLAAVNGTLLVAVLISADALVLGGILGSLASRRVGERVSLNDFSQNAVRYFKVMLAAAALIHIEVFRAAYPGWTIANGTIWRVWMIFLACIKLVLILMAFTPFAITKHGHGLKAALRESVRFWRRRWWEIMTFLGVGAAIIGIPLAVVSLLSGIPHMKGYIGSIPTAVIFTVGYFMSAAASAFFLIGLYELYSANGSEKRSEET